MRGANEHGCDDGRGSINIGNDATDPYQHQVQEPLRKLKSGRLQSAAKFLKSAPDDQLPRLLEELVSSEFGSKAGHRVCSEHAGNSFLDYAASFFVTATYLFNMDFILVAVVSAGSTSFFYYYRTSAGEPVAAKLVFTLLATAVVFPLTFLISQAFTMRQNALSSIADMDGLLTNIALAYRHWNWKSGSGLEGFNGRESVAPDFEQRAHGVCVTHVSILKGLLLLPNITRGRHLLTPAGSRYRETVMPVKRELRRRLMPNLRRMHLLVEELKSHGLPANEASRINQYNCLLSSRITTILNYKDYRTPQATRSFARVYILVLPIFAGPYYSWVGGTVGGSGQTNFAFALCLSLFSSFVLVGLFSVQRALEDPFLSRFENIHVSEDLERLHHKIDDIFFTPDDRGMHLTNVA